MARRRPPRARKRPRSPRTAPAPSATSEAEALLLALAREVSASQDTGPAAALHRLAAAHAPDAPLPLAAARAWLEGRADKTVALRLAWAREQLRLALEEILARAPVRATLGGEAETRAWLVLAAVESFAQEPPAATADRLKTLLELIG